MTTPSRLALVAVSVAVVGCSDHVAGTAPEGPEPIEPPALARMIATVDTRAGTMTFDPIASVRAMRPGVSAAVYGDQNVTVRIYNGPVTVAPAGAGKKRYTGDVGIRNLLSHSIGDEQVGTSAQNLGIFVFLTSGPTVTGTSSPCAPACTVSVVGQHGIFNFTQTGQRYWFWGEKLAPAGQTGDTTLTRETWTFEADTQVTAFQFEVLVSAAWPPPNDTRWRVVFSGDSLPNNGVEPVWVRNNLAGNVTTSMNQPQFGMIRVVANTGASLIYLRTDSVTSTMDAYIEARVQVQPVVALLGPEISLGMDDRTKFIGVGLSQTQAGFLNGSLTFIPGASVVTTTSNFQTYQLRKYAADSVVLYIDGTRQTSASYSQLPPPLTGSTQFGFFFGPLGTGASRVSVQGNSSNWDYVTYEMGVTQP